MYRLHRMQQIQNPWPIIRMRILSRFHYYCTGNDPKPLADGHPGEDAAALHIAATSSSYEPRIAATSSYEPRKRARQDSRHGAGHDQRHGPGQPKQAKTQPRPEGPYQGAHCPFHAAKFKAEGRQDATMNHTLEQCSAWRRLSDQEKEAFNTSGTLPSKK